MLVICIVLRDVTIIANIDLPDPLVELSGLELLTDAGEDVAELRDGDEADVVLVKLLLIWKVELHDVDEADFILVEFRLTWKAEVCDGDETGVVLVELHRTQKAELRDGDEASIVLVELSLTRTEELYDGDEASVVLVELSRIQKVELLEGVTELAIEQLRLHFLPPHYCRVWMENLTEGPKCMFDKSRESGCMFLKCRG